MGVRPLVLWGEQQQLCETLQESSVFTSLTPVSHQSAPQSNQGLRGAAPLTLFAIKDHEPLTTWVALGPGLQDPLGAGVMPFPYESRETEVRQGRLGSVIQNS